MSPDASVASPDPFALCQAIERSVGLRVRELRINLGHSQSRLADMLGLSYQQISKYERGTNRFSLGQIFIISRAWGVSLDWFYAGWVEGDTAPKVPLDRFVEDHARTFAAIPDRQLRNAVASLTKIIAERAP